MTDIREMAEKWAKYRFDSDDEYKLAKAYLNLLDAGWVRCEDRLPEDFKQVIVLTFVGDVHISSVQQVNVTQADQSIILTRQWHKMVSAQVTHWMPLPPPPHKEGGWAMENEDLSRCPNCGGPADNGHDRHVPPSPYYCSKCEEK